MKFKGRIRRLFVSFRDANAEISALRNMINDGHDQIMIEFCSINSVLDHLDHRGLSNRGTARSCSAIIEYNSSILVHDRSLY